LSLTPRFPCDLRLIDATAIVAAGQFDTVVLTFSQPVVAGTEYNGQIGLVSESMGTATALQPTGDLVTPSTTCTCPIGAPLDSFRQWSVLIPDGIGTLPGTMAYGDETGQPMTPQAMNVRYV